MVLQDSRPTNNKPKKVATKSHPGQAQAAARKARRQRQEASST